MKKHFLVLVMVLVVLTLSNNQVYAEDYRTPAVYIYGNLFEFTGNKPIIRNGRVLVPLKSGVFGKISATVQYDIINRESVIRTRSQIISNYMQELDWYDNGIRCYISDVRSDYINGDAYIPMRAVMESLGKTVTYDDQLYAAYID